LLRAKPGEKVEYKSSLISVLKNRISKRTFQRIVSSSTVVAIIGSYFAFFGLPQNMSQFFLTLAVALFTLLMGAQAYLASIASVIAILVPIIYIAFFGSTATIMPVLVVILGWFFGYIIGSAFGIAVPNIPELLYNGVKAVGRLLSAPLKYFGFAFRDTEKKRHLLFSAIAPIAEESDTSREFIDKYERLFIENLAEGRDETIMLPDDGTDDTGLGEFGPGPSGPDQGGPGTDTTDTTPPGDDTSGIDPSEIFGDETDEPGTRPAEDAVSSVTHETILPLYQAEGAYFDDHNHVNRVTELVQIIGQRMGISADEMDTLLQAALVHDLAKLGIDSAVLTEARKVIALKSDTIFLPLADILEIFDSEIAREIDEVKAKQLDPGVEASEIDEILKKYQSYINAYYTLFNNHEMVAQALKEQTGLELDETSNIIQIAAQHGRPDMSLEDSRNQLLAGILIAANIIDSTQALERSEYYGRTRPSLGDEKLGLFPNLERSLAQGRISREVYQTVMNLLLVEENQDILQLVAASRQGAFDAKSLPFGAVETLKAEISAYFMRIQRAPTFTGRVARTDTQESAITLEKPSEQTEEEKFSQESVNKIFEEFSASNPLPMIEFLKHFESNPDILPGALSIHKNNLFQPLRQNGKPSPRKVFETLSAMGKEMGLSLYQITQLQTILERTRYVKDVDADADVIVLDLDTLGLSPIENAANERYRKLMLQYISGLLKRYEENRRTPKIVIFSEKFNSWEMSTMMGPALVSQIDQLYGKELFGSSSTDEKFRFFSLMTTLSNHYDVNRINLKLFSNRNSVMNAGKLAGVILADREGNIFDALTVFANIHPQESADLLIKGADISLRELITLRNRGYYSLAGEECCARKSVQKRLKNIGTQHLIDNAA